MNETMRITELCKNIGYDFYKAINGCYYSFYFDKRDNSLWAIPGEIATTEITERVFDKMEDGEGKGLICRFEFGFETVRISEINENLSKYEKYLHLQEYKTAETLFTIDQPGEIIC